MFCPKCRWEMASGSLDLFAASPDTSFQSSDNGDPLNQNIGDIISLLESPKVEPVDNEEKHAATQPVKILKGDSSII